jgi:hypothetical protein
MLKPDFVSKTSHSILKHFEGSEKGNGQWEDDEVWIHLIRLFIHINDY